MTTVHTSRSAGADAAAQLTPATASPAQRAGGVLTMLGTALSNQTGAAIGATAFSTIGPLGVVAVRQVLTGVLLGALVRPDLRALRRDQWGPVLGLVVVFSTMNLFLYLAVERIGLGMAVTLEFLGPLTVAVIGSRRVAELACACVAGAGVVVLTAPGPTTDLVGIGFGIAAGASWGGYILLNRVAGQRLPGIQGTAAASVVTSAVWIPIAALWFLTHPPTVLAIATAALCGVLASVVPYAGDLLALRRVPANVYGTLSSVHPVLAALLGWIVLGQVLAANQLLGIALIVCANVAVCLLAALRPRTR